MGARANALAEDLEKALSELAGVIEDYPDDKWLAATGPEGWSVAATAQHVSGQFPLEMEYITAAAEGRNLPDYTWDDINGKNGNRAEANTTASKEHVLRELRANGSAAAAYLRTIADERLDEKVHLALASAEITVEQLIESGVLIDHVRGHLKSIQAAG